MPDAETAPPTAIPPGYVRVDWNRGFGGQVGPFYERDDPPARAFLVDERHTNGMRNCHGGMLMAFADMALGHVVSIETRRFWVTVRLLTDFVSSAQVGEFVEGMGEIVGEEDDLFTIRGRIWTGERTILSATGIFKALGPRPENPDWRTRAPA